MSTKSAGRRHCGGLAAALVVLSLALPTAASAQGNASTPPVELIVSRMTAAREQNQAHLRGYVVTREYVLLGKNAEQKRAEVTAQVSFAPPNLKRYDIVRSEGIGLGERIVRRMLDGETQIVKDYSATDISEANYDFRLLGEDAKYGARCYRLELIPKRKDKTLLRGTMWVDATTYLLRRMEAEPAKGPSWWLRDVSLVFVYADVHGMWLQTASEFTTNVRIFGWHTMTSRDVHYDLVERDAVDSLAARGQTQAMPPRSDFAPHSAESQR